MAFPVVCMYFCNSSERVLLATDDITICGRAAQLENEISIRM